MTRPSYEPERLELARMRVDSRQSYEQAIVKTTELSARTLGVERVGVWMFDPDDPLLLRLEHLYVASSALHSEGDVLVVAHAPRYREALLSSKAIVADDALTDPTTSALGPSYLVPLGIRSMLDAPLYFRGEVVGVICHEHVGAPRRWTAAEIDFACSIADAASLICEQAQRLRLERELRERVTTASAADGIETVRTLASGVAHELGNVLAAIRLGTDQLARAAEPTGRSLSLAVGEALAVGDRLTGDLRRFGDRAATPPSATRSPIRDVLGRFAPILELLAQGHAHLEIDAEPGLTFAMDDTSLEQIVLNLVLNARDALAGVARAGTIRVEATRLGERGRLSVIDDGPGIPLDVRAELERGREYFTTKPHGTGLGLSVVRRLASAAGGALSLPDVSQGTRVDVSVPIA